MNGDNRVQTTTQPSFAGANKLKQLKALQRATKPVAGLGGLKNTGILGK